MADKGDEPREPQHEPGGEPAELERAPAVDDDPPGDPDEPVETVVRYETAEERRERLKEERSHRRHRRVTEAGVALAALFVSLAVFMVNGAVYLRGSEIAVLPPEQIWLYREEGPGGATLWVAVPALMINAARADYGDVVVHAHAALGRREQLRQARFAYNALTEPTLTPQVAKSVENCPQGARCLPATGMYVIERPKRLLDVPGGASRSEQLAFQIEPINCEGDRTECARFSGYEASVQYLRAQPRPVISVEFQFHFDGRKRVECELTSDPQALAAIFSYLEEKGWASPACERAEGSG